MEIIVTDIQGPARLGKDPILKHVGEDNYITAKFIVLDTEVL